MHGFLCEVLQLRYLLYFRIESFLAELNFLDFLLIVHIVGAFCRALYPYTSRASRQTANC